MRFLIMKPNPAFTYFTFVGFISTLFVMHCKLGKRKRFPAKCTDFWFFSTYLIMVAIFEFHCLETTIRTCNDGMFFFLMLLFFCLWYAHSTNFTFIILPHATNFMHTELANWYVFLTKRTFLCWFFLFLVFHYHFRSKYYLN